MAKHINALAVGLLAIAVLVLAIKEPRCEPHQQVEGASGAPVSGAGASQRPPRELRKF